VEQLELTHRATAVFILSYAGAAQGAHAAVSEFQLSAAVITIITHVVGHVLPPHEVLLLPYEIRRQQKRQRADVDKSKKPFTFTCGSCVHASDVIAVTEARVKAVMKSTEKEITDRLCRTGKLSEHIREVNLKFVNAGPTAPKNPHRSEAARRSLAISNIVNGWTEKVPGSAQRKSRAPSSIRRRMGICLVCGKLTFDTKRPTKFHRRCWSAWLRSPNGRSFQQSLGMRRMEAKLLPRQMGRPVDENQLKIRHSWAIQHLLGGKSYRQIAKDDNVADFTIVRDGIEFIIKKLPAPDLVHSQRVIQLLHDALKEPSPSIEVLNG
jgi:hypothetical protein